MSDDNTIQAYLAKHPRLIGILFTLVLLLSQAGTVAAANSSVTTGP